MGCGSAKTTASDAAELVPGYSMYWQIFTKTSVDAELVSQLQLRNIKATFIVEEKCKRVTVLKSNTTTSEGYEDIMSDARRFRAII